ncbi:MAG TPA: ankyrin repeat domain-containing protein [Pyrinomonadaceae bacterium]|nr:ankyrin repeat domain-containing protein [Pyrinomonadaceae bacterium]
MGGDDQEIHEIASAGKIKKLKSLLDKSPELIHAKGWFNRTPLHCAAENGQVDCVRLLLERGADVHAQALHSWTPLFEAARSPIYGATLEESLECARLLLEHGADPNAVDSHRRETPIFNVNSLPMLLLLKEHGANLDVVSSEDQYPHEAHASYVGDPALLAFWLERGVDVNHNPGFGDPVLHGVIICQGKDKRGALRLEQVRMLLAQGANPNMGDRLHGKSPLHLAVGYGREDLARLLLDGGADPDFRDHANETPLHVAVKEGAVKLVRLLVERGADVNIKNISKKSPWELGKDSAKLRRILEPHARDVPDIRPTPDELIERLDALPAFSRDYFEPCSEEEIERLERTFRVILPESYKKFLRLMGRGAEGFLSSDHWDAFYPELLEIARREEYAGRCDNLPDDYFVFASRLAGVYLFFIADGTDDDPPVYSFGDGHDETFRKSHDSFWGFFEEMVIYYEFYNKKGLV